MNIIEVQQASRSLRKQFSKTVEPIHTTKPCVLVEVDTVGSAAVKGRPNYVWAREYAEAGADTGGVFQVLDLTTLPTVNLPVLVGPAPKPPYQTQVLGTNSDMLQQSNAITNPIYGQGRHAKSHVFVRGGLDPQYGTDITFGTEANFGDCICLPTDPPSMQVLVNKGCYIHEGVPKSFSGGLTPNLTSYIPGTGLGRLVYILIDGDTNAIELLSGPTFAYAQPMIDPVTYAATAVTVTIGRVLVGRVILYPGLTAINEAQFRYDIKPLLHTLSDAAGSGDVATDTIWNAKGDIAVGTGTDTATVLAIGSNGDILTVATDTPGWDTPVDIGDDAADIVAINFAEQGSKPTAPGTGHRLLYAKSNGIYEEDSGGTESILGGSITYPKRATMWHDEATVTAGGALATQVLTGMRYNHDAYQAQTSGDVFTHGCLLAAGTYTFSVLGLTNNYAGIVDWTLDGVAIASGQDWYSVGTVNNVIKVTNGVTVSTSGWHVLQGAINGKNGSSLAYYAELVKYWFKQAAD